jgi:hypothetical protein
LQARIPNDELLLLNGWTVLPSPLMFARGTFYFCLLLLSSCTKDKTDGGKIAEDVELPLLEPAAEKKETARRCSPLPGGKQVTLRSGTRLGGAARADGAGLDASTVDVGTAVAVGGGFAVGALVHGSETHAQVHLLDGRGRSQAVDLGRVHGSVDPPQVAAWGESVITAFMDNDAGHRLVRLARVTSINTRPDVSFGPEVQVPRDEETFFSVGVTTDPSGRGSPSGLLIWDAFEKSSQKSRIHALGFEPASMKISRKDSVISPPQDDAVSPTLTPRNGGFWGAWLSYAEKPETNAALDSLVEERPRLLRVQRLGYSGEAVGEPLNVTDPGETVFAYTGITLKTGELLIAYRGATLGRTEGASPVHLRKIGDDGSVMSAIAEHSELGLGAPVLLGAGASEHVWLSARGKENEILLGFASDGAAISRFDLENSLLGHMPLVRNGDELLVAQPEESGLKLSVFRCEF